MVQKRRNYIYEIYKTVIIDHIDLAGIVQVFGIIIVNSLEQAQNVPGFEYFGV